MNAFIAESSKSQRQVTPVTQVVSEEAHALHTPVTAVSARFVSSTGSTVASVNGQVHAQLRSLQEEISALDILARIKLDNMLLRRAMGNG